jgi:secreted Zn-dependent insulinase-like peptidase
MSFGVTHIEVDGEQDTNLIRMKVVAADSMKPNKLASRHETVHTECVRKQPIVIHRKLNEFHKQKYFQKYNNRYMKTIACIVQSFLQNCQM